MHNKMKRYLLAAVALAVVGLGTVTFGQAPAAGPRPEAPFTVDAKITTPKQEWGKNLGDEYFLTNYQQLLAYWKKLDGESTRMQVVEIG